MIAIAKPTIYTSLPDGVWLQDGLWVAVHNGEVLAYNEELQVVATALLDLATAQRQQATAERMFAAEISEWERDA